MVIIKALLVILLVMIILMGCISLTILIAIAMWVYDERHHKIHIDRFDNQEILNKQ